MKLTNTLSGQPEEIGALQPGNIGIYACGVTPYAESHVGHAMSAIIYDVLVRYLRWDGNGAGGYAVTHVSNYTDIDDKVIERAHELDRDPFDLSNDNIAQWEDEQTRLGLLEPDVRPRVTEEIPAIIELIERIVANGYAYATPQDNAYYRVRSKSDYGKLSHRDIEQLRSGTRFEPGEDKEFELDFALWKAAKAGEPSWPSPWGDGRPGWHIECSAMAGRYLGDAFDIHAGGVDLVFPHHENEIAQSEAAGRPFARLWMHNGMVLRDNEKMSKSIGNVVSVREALERWSPDAIRLFVLSSHYRSQNNLTDEAMDAAERGVERLKRAATPPPPAVPGTVGFIPGETLRPGVPPSGKSLDASAARGQFIAAMEDDLATPSALGALYNLVTDINRADDRGDDVSEARNVLRELADVLGLSLALSPPPTADAERSARFPFASQGPILGGAMPAATGSVSSKRKIPLGGAQVQPSGTLSFVVYPAQEIAEIASRFGVSAKDGAQATAEAIIRRRGEARTERDFATADAIRDALLEIGLELEDTPEGTRIVPRRAP